MALTRAEYSYYLVRRGTSEQEYRDYIDACLTGDTTVEKGLERYLARAFKQGTPRTFTNGEIPENAIDFLPPEIFEELILPLLSVKERVFRPVVVALSNRYCPPPVLLTSCTSSHYRYMRSAGMNVNCPEEGRVIFVLTPNPLGIVGAEGYLFEGI